MALKRQLLGVEYRVSAAACRVELLRALLHTISKPGFYLFIGPIIFNAKFYPIHHFRLT